MASSGSREMSDLGDRGFLGGDQTGRLGRHGSGRQKKAAPPPPQVGAKPKPKPQDEAGLTVDHQRGDTPYKGDLTPEERESGARADTAQANADQLVKRLNASQTGPLFSKISHGGTSATRADELVRALTSGKPSALRAETESKGRSGRQQLASKVRRAVGPQAGSRLPALKKGKGSKGKKS